MDGKFVRFREKLQMLCRYLILAHTLACLRNAYSLPFALVALKMPISSKNLVTRGRQITMSLVALLIISSHASESSQTDSLNSTSAAETRSESNCTSQFKRPATNRQFLSNIEKLLESERLLDRDTFDIACFGNVFGATNVTLRNSDDGFPHAYGEGFAGKTYIDEYSQLVPPSKETFGAGQNLMAGRLKVGIRLTISDQRKLDYGALTSEIVGDWKRDQSPYPPNAYSIPYTTSIYGNSQFILEKTTKSSSIKIHATFFASGFLHNLEIDQIRE